MSEPVPYYCVICGKCRVEWLDDDECRVVIHADVPHPEAVTFDEEDNPQ